ncbi:hypothetical protein GGS23DRAFT_557343 [Durotheca rogersii]|uniref:uncharacterized protein n=1 Tax=Durotheca rogersii TaxID=419775 RepID=UPI00221F5EFB|nr:uncharacterized protein GGS23DRAFT_557343 [Durotheca rogersii]KAI5865033.1 hypothetical protein GGS23DRAFT_557343 [Durotheca rogersii]
MPIMPIMQIRNPFARRSGLLNGAEVKDENVPPGLSPSESAQAGFEKVDTIGSMTSSALSIRSAKGRDNGDYKMSVVNDSGVYLPPSPVDDKSLWPRRSVASRTSVDTRSSLGDIEHFSISRESFDSYRRSFDISARSPIAVYDRPRQSLDSAVFPRLPRTPIRHRHFDQEPPTPEEGFEDVGLNDDQKQAQPKKRGFFAKFSEPQEPSAHPPPGMGMSRFIPGRKRAQSGQGSELGSIERPRSRQSVDEQEAQ